MLKVVSIVLIQSPNFDTSKYSSRIHQYDIVDPDSKPSSIQYIYIYKGMAVDILKNVGLDYINFDFPICHLRIGGPS